MLLGSCIIFEPHEDVPAEVRLYPELLAAGWRFKAPQSDDVQPESHKQVLAKGRQMPLRLQSSSVWQVGVHVEATATMKMERGPRRNRIVKVA